ncbi:MAG TPA: heavy metal translocating P-type ATPase [Candidatus Dormibacteraeota bacterium]|nr:heavy metal translocating P-type ATPase [Candidatus Dormibacteraeota bacterium]
MKLIISFLKKYKLLSFAIVAIILGFGLYIANYHTASNIILGTAIIVSVVPLLWDMLSTLRNGRYGIDILAAAAMITSVTLGQYWTGIIIALMLTGGEALEDYAENKAKAELKSLLDHKPRTAHLVKNKKIIDVKVSEVKIGETLSILPGEVIPVDCLVLSGNTSIDESDITGESMPKDKNPGDKLLSGAVNIEGSITVKVIHTAKDSQYEQIINLVKSASSSESPFVRLADRYSIPFTIISFMIAGSVWVISGHAIRFLEVIVVATPCPLLLAAPIALISGMSRAAKNGIIIKNGAALEKLAEVKTIAFDKTGTLTNGKPIIESIKTFNGFKEDEILGYAAALETNSNHVLAHAIINGAVSKQIKLPTAKNVKELSGHGLSGTVKGKKLLLGRLNLMQDNQIELKNIHLNNKEYTLSYMAIDNKLAGIIFFSDEIRSESVDLMKRLKLAGIKHFQMITGDGIEAAKKVGHKLGISDIVANCLPADKMKSIESIKERPVAFVGDGVNDAPVLTVADIGIALGAKGSTAASESADIVIMLDSVSKVASAVEIAKRTFYIAKQSILVGIIISIILMLIFASGKLKPIYGALLQEIVDVIVIFNALRAHGTWQKVQYNQKNKSL